MSCIKVVETQESFCVIRKFECIEAGGLPILNEFDCPYIEETGRFVSMHGLFSAVANT